MQVQTTTEGHPRGATARGAARGRKLAWLLLGWLGLHAWVTAATPGTGQYDQGFQAYQAGRYEEAINLWRPLAEAGDAVAQFSVGTLYDQGRGVPQDDAQATAWFRRAAEQGFAPAQFNLGNAYRHGRGVAASDTQAVSWWRKAADQGVGGAQFNLGSAYLRGEGVPRDEDAARRWYERAVQAGHPLAGQMLAELETARARPRAASDSGGPPPAAPPKSRAAEASPPPATATPLSSPPPEAEAPPGTAPGEPDATPTAHPDEADPRPPSPTLEADAPAPSPATHAGEPPSVPRKPALPTRSPPAGAAWVQGQPPDGFTVQLLSGASEATVRAELERYPLPGPVAIYPYRHAGAVRFALLHGAFPDRNAASKALGALPQGLRKASPWVRSFRELQALAAEAGSAR